MTQALTGKHYLIITTLTEDDGLSPYQEEREWRIVHPPDCEKSTRKANPQIEYDLCPVECEVIHANLDCAETEDGKLWTDLEDGSYEIEAWHEVIDHHYGMAEHDGGLTIYPDRPGIIMSDHDLG